MTSPLSFPDWVPPWVQLAVLIVGALFGLAFLAMPFSVFGVKSRLEALEAHLDELHGELRAMALRQPIYEEPYEAPRAPVTQAPPARPVVPPAAWAPDAAPRRPIGAGRVEPVVGPRRTEPRINPYR
jgi:hypothetical protein